MGEQIVEGLRRAMTKSTGRDVIFHCSVLFKQRIGKAGVKEAGGVVL